MAEEQKARIVQLPLGEYRYTTFGADDASHECEAYYLQMLKMDFLGCSETHNVYLLPVASIDCFTGY